MNKFLLIVELLSYFVNFITRTSRQQELSSREKKNNTDSITSFGNKFGVPVNTGTAKDTAGLQQADVKDDRPQ